MYLCVCHIVSLSLPRLSVPQINGFSKCYAMTGFRLGYSASPLPIAQAQSKLQSQMTSCPCVVSQYGGLAALQLGLVPVHSMVAQLMRSLRRERERERESVCVCV